LGSSSFSSFSFSSFSFSSSSSRPQQEVWDKCAFYYRIDMDARLICNSFLFFGAGFGWLDLVSVCAMTGVGGGFYFFSF
jgi:hypothetical protein